MTTPINPAYPIGEITSFAQLMDIAVSMEREAAECFDTLAAQLEAAGNTDTAALFRQLAQEERTHEDELERWSQREDRHKPVARHFGWRMPESFQLGDTDASDVTLTPYRALAVAVRNEERAFTFYSYLAAIATDDEVRERAEALAKGELEHVSRLRAQRRRAYHAERRHIPDRRRRHPSSADVERLAQALDHGASLLDARMAWALERDPDNELAGLLLNLSGISRFSATHDLGGDPDDVPPASNAVEDARATGLLEPGALTAQGILRLMLKDAEETVQNFLDIAEHARDEQVMAAAQRHAENAMSRLAVINSWTEQSTLMPSA